MLEDIVLKNFPKESGAYWFISNNEVIYVGSSKNLYQRMTIHNCYINKGSNAKKNPTMYQFLQSKPFTIEFQLTDNYKQLEQELIEKYNPKYNCRKANTGLGAREGREAEYNKEYREKFKEEIKQYRESHKEDKKQYNKQYYEEHKKERKQFLSQLCNYNGETLSLNALSTRFQRKGLSNPTAEAKKYLV
jgi:hypothetical protein